MSCESSSLRPTYPLHASDRQLPKVETDDRRDPVSLRSVAAPRLKARDVYFPAFGILILFSAALSTLFIFDDRRFPKISSPGCTRAQMLGQIAWTGHNLWADRPGIEQKQGRRKIAPDLIFLLLLNFAMSVGAPFTVLIPINPIS